MQIQDHPCRMDRCFCSQSNNSMQGSCKKIYIYCISEAVFWSGDQDAKLDVCVCQAASELGCLLIWSWHFGVNLVFLYLLLCLTSCSYHLAPGFENKAKFLPPEWYENIPTKPSRPVALSQVNSLNRMEYEELFGSEENHYKLHLKKKHWGEFGVWINNLWSSDKIPRTFLIKVNVLQSHTRKTRKNRFGSELSWLVWIVNFLLLAVRRNATDCPLLQAMIICITRSPLCVSVYTVQVRPCWIAALLCNVNFPVHCCSLIAVFLWVGQPTP